MPVSAEEGRRAFRDALKRLSCPHCQTAFSDGACDWSEAWGEGRRAAMADLGREERDGPVMLRCEACGRRALTDVFCSAPRLA